MWVNGNGQRKWKQIKGNLIERKMKVDEEKFEGMKSNEAGNFERKKVNQGKLRE